MFATAFDVTPVSAPAMQWSAIRPGAAAGGSDPMGWAAPTSLRGSANKRREYDLFVEDVVAAMQTPATDFLKSGTNPAPGRTAAEPVPVWPPTARRSAVDDVAEQRVLLLARQYASGPASPERELLARLEILNQKLLAMAPRVTPERVAALEAVSDKLAVIRERTQKRAERLGLSA